MHELMCPQVTLLSARFITDITGIYMGTPHRIQVEVHPE
jgi:hypothetical protein